LKLFCQAASFSVQEPPKITLEDLAPYYGEIDGRLEESEAARRELAGKLVRGAATGWWLEGERLIDLSPIGTADWQSGAGQHLVIPPLPHTSTPPPPIGSTPTVFRSPIVLSLSDFHCGQGEASDNADDVSLNLDRAYITVITAWGGRVAAHRYTYGFYQPAYLILNGDHLDFWSADMIPETGGGASNPNDRYRTDVQNVNGRPGCAPSRPGNSQGSGR